VHSEAPARNVIAVTSGKGGVGKSTVSLNLALALAQRDLRVGLLDADFYGPDIPLMVNLKRSQLRERWMLGRSPRQGGALVREPVERYGLKLMSVGFLISEAQALTLPAMLIHGALRQLLRDVAWGPLDFLIVDTPPGTADLQQELLNLVFPSSASEQSRPFDRSLQTDARAKPARPEVGTASGASGGALVVVGPQDVAHLDGRKAVDMLRAANVPIIGGVENMAQLTCPHCGETVDVFPSAAEERTIWADGVARLVSIPLDPIVASAGNGRAPLLVAAPEGPQASAFHDLADRVVAATA
jgi:ATP-binding protein involved in chromosome partitioning